MPFQNMTNDTIWNVWQDGLQDILITSLSNSEELRVRQMESIQSLIKSRDLTNYASITPSIASTISQKLDANVFICGRIKQMGSILRLNAQLIDSETEEIFKSFQIDGLPENIITISDSLSVMVKNFLIISKIEKELPVYLQGNLTTNSSEAYKLYLYGENARNKRDYLTARNMFSQALAIDSNFTLAMLMLSTACINQGDFEEARKWSIRVYKKRDQMPMKMKILTNRNHASLFETPYEELKYLRQNLEIDDQNPDTYYGIGKTYYYLYQYDKAIPELEKALEIYDKLDIKPRWIFNYSLLGWAYFKTGQNKKIENLFRKADKDFPDDALTIHLRAIVALIDGDTVTANKYIEKYKSLRRENSWSEASIAYNLGDIYYDAGNLEKAEEYHRLEISLEPDNPHRMYDLGYFLIFSDRNISEGLELIDKAMGLLPDLQWFFLEGKGWGLYKQGKYIEALEALEKCRDLSLYYSHDVHLKIQEVKEAIASQKNN
jgi:tetratricopeptide (TPR) repeat protein